MILKQKISSPTELVIFYISYLCSFNTKTEIICNDIKEWYFTKDKDEDAEKYDFK